MAHSKSWAINLAFLVTDIFLLYICFGSGLLLRNALADLIGRPYFGYAMVPWETVAPLAHLGILTGVFALLFEGMYPGYGLTAVKELEKTATSITLAFFLLAAVSFIYRPLQDYPRPILFAAWASAVIVIPLSRFLLRRLLSQTSWYGIPAIIFGDGAWAESVKESLERVSRLGWRPQMVMAIRDIEHCDHFPSHIPLAILAANGQQPVENLARILNQQFHRVVLIRERDSFGSLCVEPVDVNGQLGLEFHYHLLDPRAVWIKRTTDILGSGILLVLLSPLMLIISLLIAVDSRGPIFYSQERVGQNFRLYRIWKFRTMVADADAKLQHLLEGDDQARDEYEKYHKLAKDPRITPVGRVLRRFSLDETAQLLNVLKGDMSLVGPRVGVPSELLKVGPIAASILRVKPGMTGWWQVTRSNDTTFEQRLHMDEYYISNWSLWMDLFILMKTVWILIRGRGI